MDKMRGEGVKKKTFVFVHTQVKGGRGSKMSVFVHTQVIKIVHAGGRSINGKIL